MHYNKRVAVKAQSIFKCDSALPEGRASHPPAYLRSFVISTSRGLHRLSS